MNKNTKEFLEMSIGTLIVLGWIAFSIWTVSCSRSQSYVGAWVVHEENVLSMKICTSVDSK